MFRKKIPERRDRKDKVSDYSKHKEYLQIDFNNRCGYCDDKDVWRMTWFEIDHFVPHKYMKIIKDTDYDNLVYACRSCNNAKRAKWPTGSESQHNDGYKGFIDPCTKQYDDQFDRKEDGNIKYKSVLGHWIFHALKLHKPNHAITYKIQELNDLIDEVETTDFKQHDKLKDNLLELYQKQRQYILHLAEKHN